MVLEQNNAEKTKTESEQLSIEVEKKSLEI